jgi:DNA-directed RNA polymerase subunit F
MFAPKIIEEVPVGMGELKDELERIKKRDKELGYREGRTEEYLSHFHMLSSEKREELKKKLEGLNVPRIRDVHILKIIDIMPKTMEELKMIIQGYPITVNNENLKKIVETVLKYVPEKKK